MYDCPAMEMDNEGQPVDMVIVSMRSASKIQVSSTLAPVIEGFQAKA